MALADVVDLLCCPHCRDPLSIGADQRVLRCFSGHAFDLARQGYVNLIRRSPSYRGDTPAMVSARDRFLAAGHYRPVADRLAEVGGHRLAEPARLLDVGAGTGYYLGRLLDGWPTARAVGLDVSVTAARRTARADDRIGSVVADAWDVLPVADGVIDLVVNVFSPRNGREFARVLAPAGVVVTVTPAADHLAELRSALGLLEIAPTKQQQLQAAWAGTLVLESSETLRYVCDLDRAAAGDLVAMGPNAFHLDEREIAVLVGTVAEPVSVQVAVTLSVWRAPS